MPSSTWTLWCDEGWISYAMRYRKAVRDQIGDRYFFIGKRLRVEAKRTFDTIKKIVETDDIDAALFPTPE